MADNLKKLKQLLAELFQLDQADLDFGIYRIMNAKRTEVTRFLDHDLMPQVREAFRKYESKERSAIEGELREAIEKARELGADPDSVPKVKELQEKYKAGTDINALEQEVYSHLYNFFRRYYHEGDFISLRRYKEGVYAIPYEGEEVKLYWANHEQYYIKTSEYLRDYTFKLRSGKRVHFKLVEADTERDNNRPAGGNERRFILASDTALAEQNGELVIRFEYRPATMQDWPEEMRHEKSKPPAQKDLNAAAVESIINKTQGFDAWRAELATLRPSEKNPGRTLLEKHLIEYTARNTFDYFIHKDLGGFLRRELDFYIKNEVMHLDDIESETVARVEQYLSKIKAIRRIAHKIIEFLAQLENFQKKLWLKKKFVVESHYCVTLDRVPEELYPEIAANEAQREEWVRLFAINEMGEDLAGAVAYSEPLTVEFIKANPYLVLDSRHFGEEFETRLLASFDDVDAQCDGLLVHGENFQALNLMLERYREQVKCIYIDPPYNTGQDGFPYKDTYQHSSWLSMIAARLTLALRLMSREALFFLSTDEHESVFVEGLLSSVFGPENCVESLIWKKSYGGGAKAKHFVNLHEYVWTYARSLSDLPQLELRPDQRVIERYYRYRDARYAERGPYRLQPLATTSMDDRPNLRYAIPYKGKQVWPEKQWQWSKERTCKALENDELVFVESAGGKVTVSYKQYLRSEEGETRGAKVYSIIEKIYTQQGTVELRDILGDLSTYNFPKPTALVKKLCECITVGHEFILDFFAGSGTTAHAVINLNREDGGQRKYILVEMGEYFDTVLVPRIKKVVYSKDWKDGKPVSREGVSHMFKILRIESYDDTLNNLELKRTEAQQTLLDQAAGFREDYMLRYMLDVESRDSFLNISVFENPFAYKLNIATGSAAETKPTTVDLVETFNYLIGLRVKTIDHVRGVRVVTGTNGRGERVLILWRKIAELDNDALDAWFSKQGFNTKDQEYDIIYVNGDNNLENLRRPDQTWKVRLIEEEFHRMMFEVQDI